MCRQTDFLFLMMNMPKKQQYTHAEFCTNLLMILNPHAQSIYQDGDHNASSKVLAVHNLSERIAHQPPEADGLGGGFAQPLLLPPALPAVSSAPAVEVLGQLMDAVAIRVTRCLVALSAAL